MDILLLLVFVSMTLVLGAVLMFGKAVKDEDFDHSDEASLLPLTDDDTLESED